MALELKTISAGATEDNSELIDMTRRFWIGAALTLPVFLLAMSHLVPDAPLVALGRHLALDSIHSQHARRSLGGVAIF